MEMGSWDDAERELRERIESVRARERELLDVRAQLARRLADLDKDNRSRRDEMLTEREKQLAAREEELEAKFAATEQREREASSKLSLATAEREKLDERQRAVKVAERELAGQRRRLQEEHAVLPNSESPAPRSET
jgi:chromosome segregation ATPase